MPIADIFIQQKNLFNTGRTKPLTFRRDHLLRLRQALLKHESELLSALQADLGKPEIEAYTSELGFVISEIDLACKHLRRWAKPQVRTTSWLHWPAKAYILPEPRGVVLIMGPWNYPLQLVLLPLVGAMAAGNCAVIKPSELAPHTAQALVKLIGDTFQSDYCHVAVGDAQAAAAYLQFPWDHIFFTGSSAIGRLVMQAASAHLTSVTLELGGKNPCVVMADSPLEITAERIAWGKFLNAGQTCGAPDHVYVQRTALQELTVALIHTLQRFYGTNPKNSPDYGRIINQTHWERLVSYLPQGQVLQGGQHDRATKYLAPTLLTNVAEDAPIMQTEIFGPILPLLVFDELDALLEELQTRPKPLAAYLFTRDATTQNKFLTRLQAGCMAINDTLSQITTSQLPLGGVGASGQGRYHGQESFACFTHYKSVLAKNFRWNNQMKYPPYNTPLAWLKKFYPWLV